MPRVLVVEDDPRVRRFLEEALKTEGYEVSVCTQTSELSDLIESPTESFDIGVFDRMLFGEDTLGQLKAFKQSYRDTKILVLSAINNSEQKALALDQGADDYLAKPYSLVELSARLRALLRRPGTSTATSTLRQIGNLSMDLVSHEISIDGKRIDLSNKEYKVLSCLAQRPGQVLSKYQLLDRVWDVQSDLESNVVETTILHLRRKLESAGAAPKLRSKRNVGYWIET